MKFTGAKTLLLVLIGAVIVAAFVYFYSSRQQNSPSAVDTSLATTTPMQYASDLAAAISAPRFVDDEEINNNIPLPADLQKIKDDAKSILTAATPANEEFYSQLSLKAVGKRYVLVAQPIADSYEDIAVDFVNQTATTTGGGYKVDTKDAVIYISYSDIRYYKLDTPTAIELPNAQLTATNETYNSGGDFAPVPVETHTDTSLRVSVFDMNTVAENPGTANYKYKKLRDVTFTLP